MSFKPLLTRIDELQSAIEAAGKFDPEVLKKINYKFRLDWNYHSNAMEGNSLTKEETRSVMVNNVTVEGKPIKDVLEIKGHDKVITDILKIGKGELRLSERRIKDIHKAIIHEDDPEQQKKIGEWKNSNNHLINYKGEKFDFLAFQDVPEAMHELIDWLNAQTEQLKNKKNTLHPVLISFEFHLNYLSIHPFYDGNGRTARILTNLILISFGYPPIIIKLNDRNAYNQYLADIQGYGGDKNLYYEFMCKLLIHSQELVLKAIEGKDIEEADDLDKKLRLLEKELDAVDPDNTVSEQFSPGYFLKIYDTWISDLLLEVIPVVQKFNKFFTGTQHYISFFNNINASFKDQTPEEIIETLALQANIDKDEIQYHNDTGVNLYAHYGTFKKGGLQTFGCNYGFQIKFDFIRYYVLVDEFVEEPNKRKYYTFEPRLLHKPLTKADIDLIAKILGNTIYEHIDFYTKKYGIR